MKTWIDNGRLLASFAVVLLHVSASVVMTVEPGSAQWWPANLYEAVSRWCVPVFVMISGALLLPGMPRESSLEFYRKRALRLLPALLFWSVVYLCWNLLKSIVAGRPVAAGALLDSLLGGVPHYHLWYLFMLVGLYAVVPWCRSIVRHTTGRQLRALVAGGFVLASLYTMAMGSSRKYQDIFLLWFVPLLPYFLAGHLLAAGEPVRSAGLPLLVLALSVVATAGGCYLLTLHDGMETAVYFYDYLSITVIPLSLAAALLLRRADKPFADAYISSALSQATFGIYLVHPVIFESFSFLLFKPTAFAPAFSIPLIAVIVYLASWVVVRLLAWVPLLDRCV